MTLSMVLSLSVHTVGMPVDDVESRPVERNNYANRSWGKSEFPFSLNYAQPQQRQTPQNKSKINRRPRTSRVSSTPTTPQIDTNNPPQLFQSTGWGPMGK